MVYVWIVTHLVCFFGGYALCLNRAKAKAKAKEELLSKL